MDNCGKFILKSSILTKSVFTFFFIKMGNSIVLVDTKPQDDINEGKIYFFRIPYRGFIIPKVEKSPVGLYLVPYNTSFETRRIPREEFNPEYVIGRVLWNIINPIGF